MFKAHAFHCRARLAFRLAFICIISGLLLPARATNRNWTGGGADNHWTTAANWQGNVAPVAGDNLIFSGASNAGTQSNYNSYAAGTVFGQISINQASDQSFVLGGNRIVLTNGIATTGPFSLALAANLDLDITLGANQTFAPQKIMYLRGTLDLNNDSLTLNNLNPVIILGNVTNSAGYASSILKTNSGSLTIGSQQFSTGVAGGGIAVYQGTVFVTGPATNASISLFQGAAAVVDGAAYQVEADGVSVNVSGTGTISAMYVPPLSLGASFSVTPGDNGAPGILSCGTFAPGAGTLNMSINGTTPGSNYSQLVVSSNYVLNGEDLFAAGYCTLALQGGYVPQLGDTFSIVKLTSGIPYSFATNFCFYDLPPGFIYELTNGVSLGATYDTNGVTLKAIHTASSSFAIWKGSGSTDLSSYGDLHWSLATNWAGGMAPSSGIPIELTPYSFSAYQSNYPYPPSPLPLPPLTNDLPESTTIPWLLLSGTNYILTGNPLTITEGITNTAAGTNWCYLDVATAGPLAIEVDSGGTVVMSNVLAGSGTISKEGAGTLLYSGTTVDAYIGTLVVDNGALQMDGSFTDGSFTVNGGLLDGNGSISSVTMNGGTLRPGDSPGIMHMDGDFSMAPGAVFEAELNGPIPGSGYDQLQVNGSVNLNGATLNLVPGYAAAPGAAFLILVNDGTDSIVGTFAGLPEGAFFQAGGQLFSISYKAGSGHNDVVVTRVTAPPAQPTFTKINLLSGGTVQLEGTGTSNVNYTVQANTNLLSTNWQNIGTTTPNGSNVFSFSTSNVFSFPQRFFRLVVP